MISIRPVLHTRKRADGTHLVQLCITHTGQPRTFAATGVYVSKAQWNPNGNSDKLNWVRAPHPNFKNLNLAISSALQEARTHGGKPTALIDFLVFFSQMLEANRATHTGSWVEAFTTILRDVEAYAPRAAFSDLNRKWMRGFELALIARGNGQNTATKKLKNLHVIIQTAVEYGHLDKDPLAGYPYRTVAVVRNRLTKEQISLLASAQLTPTLALARDFFLFCYYGGGLRVSEALSILAIDVQADAFVFQQRKKKGMILRRERGLRPEAAEILARHWVEGSRFAWAAYIKDTADLSNHRVFSSPTSRINNALLKIEKLLDLPHLHNHLARHSLADQVRRSSGDVHAIKDLLGHSNIATTERYLAGFDQQKSDDLLRTAL